MNVTLAILVLHFAAGGAPNDACAAAMPIAGEGVFTFDNAKALPDGPSHVGCSGSDPVDSQIVGDVWYCWTAPCDGPVRLDTCEQTTVDTKIAVYDGCACPQDDSSLLACNDNDCVYQSRVEVSAVAGQTYLLRIGTNSAVGGGTGTFTIDCGEAPDPPCAQPSENCQRSARWTARASDGTNASVTDDFTPETDGSISSICWWGTYRDGTGDCRSAAADMFEVTYYGDANNVPGALLAGPFKQSDGSLVVAGPARSGQRLLDAHHEYEYSASHAPVSVLAGQCYWVEVVNRRTDGCTWYWSSADSTRGLAMSDGAADAAPDGYDGADLVVDDAAFCLDVSLDYSGNCRTVPSNDSCDAPMPIAEGLTLFDTTLATLDGRVYSPSCQYWKQCCTLLGDSNVYRDIWYTYVPPCSADLYIETCSSMFDTRVTVNDSTSCSQYGQWIACSDDACGDVLPLQSALSVPVWRNWTYLIEVGGYALYDDDEARWSNCFFADGEEPRPGCDNEVCESLVCYWYYGCCSSDWDDYCAEVARYWCTGHGGPGSIYLELVAPPPADETLRDYTDFLACFSGPCDSPPCDPPVYTEQCCLTQDYDDDGDVDTDDYALFGAALTGP